MTVVWRLLLAASMALWGLSLGTSLGGQFLVPQGQGLAGPVEALAYGLLAAALAAGAAVFATWAWSPLALKRLSLGVSISALLLLGYLYTAYLNRQNAALDPDSAYAGIPEFTVSWEQVIVQDPYLRTKMDVNSVGRSWVSAGPAPKTQLCRGIVRAAQLQKISTALEKFVAAPSDFLAPCTATLDQAEQKLSWDYLDGRSTGSLEISKHCLDERAIVFDLTRAVFNASQSPTSPVRCD